MKTLKAMLTEERVDDIYQLASDLCTRLEQDEREIVYSGSDHPVAKQDLKNIRKFIANVAEIIEYYEPQNDYEHR